MVPSVDGHQLIYNFIQNRTGLVLNDYQRIDVSNLLAINFNLSFPEQVINTLSGYPLDHALWRQIIRLGTIGETYFFRNQPQFNALRQHILSGIIEQKRKSGSRQLRLWSAGCSTGEEPYSLAILLRELIPDIELWSITLLATDINDEFLEKAQQGIYRPRSFRSETPDDLADKWFTSTSDGYQIKQTVRNMVLFKKLNLVSDAYPAFDNNTTYMDLIMCRNVTIYFDITTTRQVIQRFNHALVTGGWLVVGHSEPHTVTYQGFVPQNFKDTVIYQKKDIPQPVSTRSAPAIKPAPEKPRPPKPTVTPPAVPAQARKTVTQQDYWVLAKFAADHERWDEANQWLDRAEQTDQFQPQVHYLRGIIAFAQGDLDGTLKLMRQATYCDNQFVLAHFVMGDIYQGQRDKVKARRHWQQALSALESHAPEVHVPFSDEMTVEILRELLTTRLAEIDQEG